MYNLKELNLNPSRWIIKRNRMLKVLKFIPNEYITTKKLYKNLICYEESLRTMLRDLITLEEWGKIESKKTSKRGLQKWVRLSQKNF